MFATNSKRIYKYIQRMKEQKEGRRKEREGRKEKRGELWGREVERRKHYFIITFFFLIGRKILAKYFTSLLTDYLREKNPYHLITCGFSLNTRMMQIKAPCFQRLIRSLSTSHFCFKLYTYENGNDEKILILSLNINSFY